MADLPNRIRELRTAPRPGFPRGWSLEKLAEEVGCGITQISNLETGTRRLSYHWMQRVARALGVTADELLLPGDVREAMSAEEMRLLAAFRRGDDAQRAQALAMIEIMIPETNGGRKAA